MPRLEPDPFLTALLKMFERNRTTGSVWITFKHYNPTKVGKKSQHNEGPSKAALKPASSSSSTKAASEPCSSTPAAKPSTSSSKPFSSSAGPSNPGHKSGPHRSKKAKKHLDENTCLVRATDGKRKVSTIIRSKDVVKFQMAYATLCRGYLDTLENRSAKVVVVKRNRRHEQ